MLFTNFGEGTVSTVLTSLLQNDTLKAGFPNLEHLASIACFSLAYYYSNSGEKL